MPDQIALPQPDEVTDVEKDDAMGAYLMMFAALAMGLPLPLINLAAAIIYFSVNRRSSRFVAFHAYQSLLFHIPVSVVNIGAMVWFVVLVVTDFVYFVPFLVYLGFAVACNVVFVIYSIVAMVRSRRGEIYYLPFAGATAFARYFGPSAVPLSGPARANVPPPDYRPD